ncbi:BON domain-containing protein [Microcoleus sp. AT3-D2]|uniref:BON domain-containing protein n=1 Tax=Microcoleus sp. AT3-D2 TaxID=2818612 RepID=UPI002FD277F8
MVHLLVNLKAQKLHAEVYGQNCVSQQTKQTKNMQLLKLLVQGISVSTVAVLGLGACTSPNTPQTTVPSTSAPTTATGNTTVPTTPAPATTTAQTPQNQDIDDIADRVEEALDSDITLKQFDLDADDRDNSIVLTGRVQTAEQKALAEQIARQTAANVSINNEIVTQ